MRGNIVPSVFMKFSFREMEASSGYSVLLSW